ncbi:hypothetical protein [Brachybacterium paraconglomeratum]|jgi:hypothetical protein|uniref:hypothetical protein n=1 Tax=Brachybacterium paraconglomeratum TaxID=173362 RepID=UPI00026C7092|nr:hypothetical protein [Brachybacterium paraconglomeratum]
MLVEHGGTAALLDVLVALAPFSTAIVGAIAAAIALFTLSHRRRADSRAEWWRRVEYALDLTREDDKVGRNTGMQLLVHLLDDRRWDPTDVTMLDEANEILVQEILERSRRATAPRSHASRRAGVLGRLVSRNSVRRSR